ncbi:ABC transporter permease [Catalinimonas niigatensis]|uniref:ABC transporter permease n=1 Tax=Catalinimonas niigatensis TaxID=1397264 RepID=UPI002665524C|nr:ABC transporter permease [Catalinimonas niigatensis]WPP48463.1 ABC transporter permease [Catalinimonas niigatensis]
MHPHPPKYPLRFLRWFCREDYLEEIEGNLLELYEHQYEESPAQAGRKFFWNVLWHFRPAFIRSFKVDYTSTQPAMIRHNFILAFRNFQRYKSSFFINLIGLSSGLACALLIYLWVNDELSIDTFNDKDSQLYQVMKNNSYQGNINTDESTPGLLASTLAEEMPEVEHAVSVFPPADYTLKGILAIDETYVKARSKFADHDFFKVFTYPLLQGDKDQVLSDPSAVVISEALANNLFHTTDDVLGKTVTWKGDQHSGDFRVAGVFENPPANATIQFDIVFSYELMQQVYDGFENLGDNGPSTYVLLKENTDVARFNDKIINFLKTKDEEASTTLFTRPYSDRYLYSDYENGVLVGGRVAYVQLFSIIAIFILLIACINFMNLSTAKASRRLKEIGVKKAIGADRKALFTQYLGESMLLTSLSLILALILVLLILPQFNHITGKQLTLHFDRNIILSITGITLFTGFIAGSYPAVYLSGFNPVSILKGGGFHGRSKSSGGEIWARKGLVVFQFTISILLTVSVLVVYQQMTFIQSKHLGYKRDNVITFTAEGKIAEEPETFLSEIRKIPGVVNASYMDGDLINIHNFSTSKALEWEGKNPDDMTNFYMLRTGYDLVETLHMELKEGRSFSRNFSAESSGVIFNEAAIESMGLTNPVGKTVKVFGEEKQIIGVVKNFHFESLYENVHPFYFMLSDRAENMMVKIEAGTAQEILTQLGEFYQAFNQGVPFDYRFLDEDYQKLYASENRVAVLSRYFAGITILISCLGLFGLAAFTAERRLKEIGIRKILGSSSLNIIRLLSADFTGMVLIAIIVALPISYLIAQSWLQDFAFSIELKWWYFAGAGLAALLIAWFTVGLQTVKAARVNPVECLKDE